MENVHYITKELPYWLTGLACRKVGKGGTVKVNGSLIYMCMFMHSVAHTQPFSLHTYSGQVIFQSVGMRGMSEEKGGGGERTWMKHYYCLNSF